MDSPRGSLLRLGAGFVLATGLILVVLRLVTGRQAGEAPLPMIASAGVYLMLAVGLGMALIGIAGLLDRRSLPASQVAAAPPTEASAVNSALTDIRDELSLLRSNIAADQARRENEEEDRRDALAHTVVEPQSLQRVLQQLDELRELTLLSDQQRQDRLSHLRQQRKRARLRAAQDAIARHEFGKAQQVVDEVRQQLVDPGDTDADLAQVENELRIARANLETEALTRVRTEVEDLMALSHWDEALAKASDFATGFPDNADGQSLLARVTRERDLYRDNTAERIYKEVREHLDHRQWRRALTEAERLVSQFPDHKRAHRIQDQLTVIRENAEIQERQEQEKRIEELIRSKRFNEAIELAEDLIERFPDSPQGKGLSDMLPRLRERAIKDEITQA